MMTMIDETTISMAAEALLRAAPVGAIVILFGSYADGTARVDSDLDFLVVEPEPKERFHEMARLSRILGDMLIPADVVVISLENYDRYRNRPNTIAYEASKKGRVYESIT